MIKKRATGKSTPKRTCPQCGASFVCDLQAGKKTCWCTAYPPIMPLDDSAKECLCPDCLKKAIDDRMK